MESDPKSPGGKSSSLIRDGISNFNSESEVHFSSAPNLTISTRAGKTIERSDEQWRNAQRQIAIGFEPRSNVISASAVHLLKQDLAIFSIWAGMQIETNDEQPANATFPI
jgi:hypothetical protein